MVRAMPGQGLRMISSPPLPSDTGEPSCFTMSGTMPKNGLLAEPGLLDTAPGIVEIMMPPVSVCHQVSTIGQRSFPITFEYHIHVCGLIGSPTLPSNRRLSSLCRFGNSSPHLINARMAVGAV